MYTYFILAELPLETEHRLILDGYHREATGNALAVLPNPDKTACLIKVKTSRLPEDIVPNGMEVIDLLSDIGEARALLREWVPALPSTPTPGA